MSASSKDNFICIETPGIIPFFTRISNMSGASNLGHYRVIPGTGSKPDLEATNEWASRYREGLHQGLQTNPSDRAPEAQRQNTKKIKEDTSSREGEHSDENTSRDRPKVCSLVPRTINAHTTKNSLNARFSERSLKHGIAMHSIYQQHSYAPL